MGEAPLQPLEIEHLQHLRHLPVLLLLRRFFQLQAVGDILVYRHVGEQGVLLEHQGCVALEGRQAVHSLAVHQDVTLLRLGEARQLAHQRGLAAAGRAQQSHESALWNLERYVVQRHKVVKLLDNVPKLDISIHMFRLPLQFQLDALTARIHCASRRTVNAMVISTTVKAAASPHCPLWTSTITEMVPTVVAGA